MAPLSWRTISIRSIMPRTISRSLALFGPTGRLIRLSICSRTDCIVASTSLAISARLGATASAAAPFYDGETLERRLARSHFSVAEGVGVAVKLARAVDALHRAGVVHCDIKPDNVILTADGGLRLVDLGVARVPRLEEFPVADIPGTPSFMAPELFRGQAGDEASDLYALGVTVYRLYSGGYPYGEVEPFMTPRFGKCVSISRARPDLPAWLDVVVGKAVAVDPAQRFGDAIEFAHELERGVKLASPTSPIRPPLYERDPLAVWQLVALGLATALAALLIHDFGGGWR